MVINSPFPGHGHCKGAALTWEPPRGAVSVRPGRALCSQGEDTYPPAERHEDWIYAAGE